MAVNVCGREENLAAANHSELVSKLPSECGVTCSSLLQFDHQWMHVIALSVHLHQSSAQPSRNPSNWSAFLTSSESEKRGFAWLLRLSLS